MLFRNSTLFFLTFLMFEGNISARSETPVVSLKPIPNSSSYMIGKKAARERFFGGAFSIGFVCGLTLPFVVGGCGNWASESTGSSRFATTTVCLYTTILWFWGGRKLAQLPSIRIPEQFHTNLNGQERIDFDSGYLHTARARRNAQYNIGVGCGVLIPVTLFIMIISSSGGFIGDPGND
jgi:hypothetical protein